ncbi:3-deoxy-D-manno-octulosonic acid transferase [Yoonia litorea]|uniref:3-deoxy-D-manno-octulosonic acid transferase n=1 Tax=Yoonia litorea TaxID=1123755 RepID=A0A1I6MWJ0_9RHOB|nr:glycosyltransferase N-terminal domain-containing protein [Yoonia litorea]SFS20024.1 3-deoxy-D-manno-octulosonic-acid transferase [Yoonia litorea]
MKPFDRPKVGAFLWVWRAVWFLGLPIVLAYLWFRGRKDPDYFKNVRERFGVHQARQNVHIWVHAVSFGELKSAEPLIRSLLNDGNYIVTTHITPAGRRAAQRLFAEEVQRGQLVPVWMPFDYPRAYRRFFDAFRPKFGLVMEVEIWPGMIAACAAQSVPLFLCNGQYPTRSFEKDAGKIISRRDLVSGFAGVMVKNTMQADRFRSLGQSNVAVTGEMRFEMPINEDQVGAALTLRGPLDARPIVAFTSVVEGEDKTFIAAIKESGVRAIYVPRAPERFGETAQMLEAAGLNFIRRSETLDADLTPIGAMPTDWDVLLGDSMGEMYFYLALCDMAVIGGGFVPKGSHNIIEPLALSKPVIVGPEIWTITYPAEEALDAKVARQVSASNLPAALTEPLPQGDISAFLASHGGSVAKTLAALRAFGISV